MPRALALDWGPIKAAYYQGLTAKDICEQFGLNINTYQQKKRREGWCKSKAKALQVAADVAMADASKTLGERAKRFVEKVANLTETHVSTLDTLNKPKNTKELRAQAETLAIIQKTGRTAFGLDDQAHSTIINVGIMTQVKDNIIDVEGETL